MKLSLSWIKDFVNIPEDMDMKQLAYDLTMDTVEVEDVEYLADRFDHMVVGVIEDIEPHPNADKLYVLKVDIGGEERTIVSGLKDFYKPEEILGKKLAMIVNLKPVNLRGVESNGMILAAESGDTLSLLRADRDIDPGAKIR